MDELGQGKMSTREAMITLAGKPFSYGEQKRWLQCVADRANISVRAARSLWRGEISDQNNRAAVAVQRALELKQARAEAKALAAQYQSIIGGMRRADENFYSADIDRLERIVDRLGTSDRS